MDFEYKSFEFKKFEFDKFEFDKFDYKKNENLDQLNNKKERKSNFIMKWFRNLKK